MSPGVVKTLEDLALAQGAPWADCSATDLLREDGIDFSEAISITGLQRAEISETVFGIRYTQSVAGAIVHHVELYVLVPHDPARPEDGGDTIIRQYRIRGDEYVP